MRRIAIILTVHNRKHSTLQCLTKLFSQAIPSDCDLCVYMTDDGCTDGTPEAVKELFPQVHIIKGDGNLFWTRGMWTAWNEAAKEDFDYYLWLNDDTMLHDNAITEIINESLEAFDKAVITGATCSILTGNCTYGLYYKGKLLEPNGLFQSGDGMNGNFVLVPKYVFDILGNLDPYYPHAGGDTDYGLRAIENGIPVCLSKKYIGTCEKHPSLEKWCDPQTPFSIRWKSLNKPKGMPLRVMFYHDKKHKNIVTACFHVITTALHCCFPNLWIKYKL